jgi:hypothetical protein
MADRRPAGRPFAVRLWYALVAAGGGAFGLIAERRPFGESLLLHPLMVFCLSVALALLVLRVAIARPVPDVIPDRALMLGCVLGLVAFLAGNFIAAHALGALR